MSKVNQEVLLQRAEKVFLEGRYGAALRLYGLVLKEYPLLEEANVGACLSDLGEENAEEAQALFDYYQLIKGEQANAMEMIHSLMDSLDTTKESILELLEAPMEEQIEYGDGIRYSDFMMLVQSRGSFKKTFEDIMFSTKVVITDKDEFIDFVTKLADEGFDEMALGYLDATVNLFGNDQEVLALYNVVQGVKK